MPRSRASGDRIYCLTAQWVPVSSDKTSSTFNIIVSVLRSPLPPNFLYTSTYLDHLTSRRSIVRSFIPITFQYTSHNSTTPPSSRVNQPTPLVLIFAPLYEKISFQHTTVQLSNPSVILLLINVPFHDSE